MYISSELSNLKRNAADQSIDIISKYGIFHISKTDANYTAAVEFYNAFRRLGSQLEREEAYKNGSIIIPAFITGESAVEVVTETASVEVSKETILEQGLTALIDFFSEFEFTPSYRFTNTLAYMANKNITTAKNFVKRYFSLINSSFCEEVSAKIKSKEFSEIIKNISQYGLPANRVNDRFKIYYGAAGTGKTTLAQTETDNRCIVCNASMLPADLMENFVFKDGRPDFNPSMLWECMEQGKPIVFDEINLLPFDSLRFLQGIVDGKSSFIYKNREVHIKDGFKIIGTMNLTLGGVTYGLPEPLVDRCEDIQSFELSAAQLMGAITGKFVAG